MSARVRCVAAMASGAVAAGVRLAILFWRCGVSISTGGVYLFTRWCAMSVLQDATDHVFVIVPTQVPVVGS